jgi:hypothetical protein
MLLSPNSDDSHSGDTALSPTSRQYRELLEAGSRPAREVPIIRYRNLIPKFQTKRLSPGFKPDNEHYAALCRSP